MPVPHFERELLFFSPPLADRLLLPLLALGLLLDFEEDALGLEADTLDFEEDFDEDALGFEAEEEEELRDAMACSLVQLKDGHTHRAATAPI